MSKKVNNFINTASSQTFISHLPEVTKFMTCGNLKKSNSVSWFNTTTCGTQVCIKNYEKLHTVTI
jgi:hypothetical protein